MPRFFGIPDETKTLRDRAERRSKRCWRNIPICCVSSAVSRIGIWERLERYRRVSVLMPAYKLKLLLSSSIATRPSNTAAHLRSRIVQSRQVAIQRCPDTNPAVPN